MKSTGNLALPYILPSQAQKHVTHNEALQILDILVHLSVKDNQLSISPQSPQANDRYIVGVAATGAWLGRDGEIASFQDGTWTFFKPQTGWRAWCEASSALLTFDGSSWTNRFANLSGRGESDVLGINATPDSINRFALSSAAALFNHEGSDHRLFINKSAAADTASMVFQTDFTAHAEVGLTGNNNLSIKVANSDGDLDQALTLLTRTGFVGFGTSAPRVPLHVTSNTTPQIRLQPVGQSDSVSSEPSVLDFWSTFDAFPKDQNPRRTASVRAAFDGGIWGHETLSFHVGGSFDAGGIPIERMRITAAGRVGIGIERPSTALHVNGALRVSSHSSASIPDPSALGEGAILFATDAPLGPGLVVSDGTKWM